MDKDNLASILSFFNLIAAELGLEDFQSLGEIRNLMPIVANYTKTGRLTFVSDQNFGFRDAVKLVSHELDDPFHTQLNPEVAEKGDQFEIAKIYLALLYTLRLLQKESFSSLCEKLRPGHQCRIAEMIGYLDDRLRWAFVPWPQVLKLQQTSSIQSDDKENSPDLHCIATPPHMISYLKDTTFSSSANRINCYSSSPQARHNNLQHNQQQENGTGGPFRCLFDFGSPIAKVVNSPRGEEVVRMHSLEKEVKSLREIRDTLGREKDRKDELCEAQDHEIRRLKRNNVGLEERLSRYLPRAQRCELLEEQLLDMQKDGDEMGARISVLLAKCGQAEAHNHAIAFERDEALQKAEIKQAEMVQLQRALDEALKRAKDELDMHEQTRKKLLDMEYHYSKGLAEQKAKVRECTAIMDAQKQEVASRIEQKEQEVAAHYDMINQFKARSEETVMEAHKKVQELEADLHFRATTLDELYEISTQQKDRISELEKTCKGYREQAEDFEMKWHELLHGHAFIDGRPRVNVQQKGGFLISICSSSKAEKKSNLVDKLIRNVRPTRNRTFDFKCQNEFEPWVLLENAKTEVKKETRIGIAETGKEINNHYHCQTEQQSELSAEKHGRKSNN